MSVVLALLNSRKDNVRRTCSKREMRPQSSVGLGEQIIPDHEFGQNSIFALGEVC